MFNIEFLHLFVTRTDLLYNVAGNMPIEKEAGSEAFLEYKSSIINFTNFVICKLDIFFDMVRPLHINYRSEGGIYSKKKKGPF